MSQKPRCIRYKRGWRYMAGGYKAGDLGHIRKVYEALWLGEKSWLSLDGSGFVFRYTEGVISGPRWEEFEAEPEVIKKNLAIFAKQML